MSIYRFSNESPIASVTFRYTDGVPKIALIEAAKTATPEQIAAANAALKEKSLTLLPVTVDDREMLQVSGFLTEQFVIDALTGAKLANGAPEITQEKTDLPPPSKGAFKTFLENNSFRLAGMFNLIGDVAMHVGGYKKISAKADGFGNPLTSDERKKSVVAGTKDLVGGGLYTLGGFNSLAFGNSKNEAPPLTDRTANFVAHIADPQSVTLTPKKSESFLRRHTADTTLAAYTLGAGVLFEKGLSEYQALKKDLRSAVGERAMNLTREKEESSSLMWYGGVSLVVKLLSLFIKEKPKSEEDKPKSSNPLIRAKDWFVEKPLRIFGLGSFITDTLYARFAYKTYKRVKGTQDEKSKSEYIFKIITTASYFASDFLAAISSKNLMAKPLDADGERGVIALAAKSIAEQSPEKRDELVTKTAAFLSEQSEIQHGKKSIAASLQNQLKHLGSNPWAKWVETPEPALNKQR